MELSIVTYLITRHGSLLPKHCKMSRYRAAIYLDLIFSMLRGSLRLVEALKGSIHALIEAPVTVYRDPVQITAVLD